jgi:hypothetical protein
VAILFFQRWRKARPKRDLSWLNSRICNGWLARPPLLGKMYERKGYIQQAQMGADSLSRTSGWSLLRDGTLRTFAQTIRGNVCTWARSRMLKVASAARYGRGAGETTVLANPPGPTGALRFARAVSAALAILVTTQAEATVDQRTSPGGMLVMGSGNPIVGMSNLEFSKYLRALGLPATTVSVAVHFQRGHRYLLQFGVWPITQQTADGYRAILQVLERSAPPVPGGPDKTIWIREALTRSAAACRQAELRFCHDLARDWRRGAIKRVPYSLPHDFGLQDRNRERWR